MTKVFIGGSRKISRLSPDVRKRLDRIMEKGLFVLIGDANGSDKAVQAHLLASHYDLVEVFCAGVECRNNVGGWHVRRVRVDGSQRNFSFFAVKDRVMAKEATLGLMIWDGKSVGTLMNIWRLANQAKKVVVYIFPWRKFVEIREAGDLEQLVDRCPPEVRRRLQQEVTTEQQTEQDSLQPHLL